MSEHVSALKDPPGHVRQMSVKSYGNVRCVIALECSCGSVFSQGEFVVDDALNREAVFRGGYELARTHVAEALAVISGGQS